MIKKGNAAIEINPGQQIKDLKGEEI